MQKIDETIKQQLQHLRHDDHEQLERQWLTTHATNPATKTFLTQSGQHFTHSEMTLLTHLAADPDPVSFKALRQTLALSQGMLSRYVNRLDQQGLLEKFHQAGNSKSIYLRTTQIGQEIGQLHHQLHVTVDQRFSQLMAQYSPEELALVNQFLEQMVTIRQTLE